MKIIYYIMAVILGFFGILSVLNLLSNAGLSPLQFLTPMVVLMIAVFFFQRREKGDSNIRNGFHHMRIDA